MQVGNLLWKFSKKSVAGAIFYFEFKSSTHYADCRTGKYTALYYHSKIGMILNRPKTTGKQHMGAHNQSKSK